MFEYMQSGCFLCPRECGVDREKGYIGYCGMTNKLKIARASLHMWEEPCISGQKGSGTIFFSGCSLRCVFCQNRDIAIGNKGINVSIGQLAELFLVLQDNGATNINLVTPTHYILQIVEAINMAKNQGLKLPIVYNTSGYEKVENIKRLDGLIDIYLPDFKYKDNTIALKYSNVVDYFSVADKALQEMCKQISSVEFKNDIMFRGVIVRHMVMPGYTSDSKAIIKHLHDKYGDSIFISIMNQYTPMEKMDKYPEINRKITKREYEKVIEYAIDLGIKNAFVQEGNTASESFIPDFDSCEFLNKVIC